MTTQTEDPTFFGSSTGLRALEVGAFAALAIVTLCQTTPLWTRLVLGKYSAAQHLVLIFGCVVAYLVVVARGPNRLLLWFVGALVPVGLTFATWFHEDANNRLQVLASTIDLLRLPAAAMLGAVFHCTKSAVPKIALIILVIAMGLFNGGVAAIENISNEYFLEIPSELTTTIENSLDTTLGMEGELRPRAACITPNGLASVLALSFLVAVSTAVVVRSRVQKLVFTVCAVALVIGIYFSTVRSVLGPALLVLALWGAHHILPSVFFRRTTYWSVFAFAVVATLAIPVVATIVESNLRPYLGRLASSSSSMERNENWSNIQSDILQSPEIAILGIDLQGIGIEERSHKSSICDNFYYYAIYHWGIFGVVLIGYFAALPLSGAFNDDRYGRAIWLVGTFVVLSAAFTDAGYYLPAALWMFLVGASSAHRYAAGAPDEEWVGEHVLALS